ncbi:MAG: DUF1800 family protein, partial [Pseudomonadota bacterium]
TDPAATEQVSEGDYSLYGELDAWEGIYLNVEPGIRVSADGYLSFSIYSESNTDIVIQTSSATIGDGRPVSINVPAKQWQKNSIALSTLGVQNVLSGVWWQQYRDQASGGVYLDNIRITPDNTVNPVEPENPAEPELPVEPENPAEPELPVDPENPAEPELPVEPENPVEPDTEIDPDPPIDLEASPPFVTADSTARFLSHGTFGATSGEIDRLTGTSASEWFRQELNKLPARYLEEVLVELQQPGATDPSGEPTFQGRSTPNFVFWQHAIGAPDQLRQRMMYALSQILVVSNSESTLLFDRPTSVAAYQDILSRHALGNYRDLLEDVTYSSAMGEYLTYMQSRKGDDAIGRMPDENYARELMQLFTIGLVELNMDGTPKLQNGEPIETYSNRDVSGLARVFTGMSYALEAFEPGFVPISSPALSSPMVFFTEHHENGEKQFLGNTIPAGTSGKNSITMALDALMAHPNTPPFVARQLIQRFVHSHPTPDYVRRVATAFAEGRFSLPDNSIVGAGRRGDLSATLAAILFDREALQAPGNNPQSGKLREPVLRFTHWARAFDASALTVRNLPSLWNTGAADSLSQSPFRSPSVFNFYRPGYIAPGTQTGAAGLTMPELQLVSASSVPGFVNFMRDFVFAEAQGNSNPDIASSFAPDYTEELALADRPDALIDRLNRILAAGRLSPSSIERIAGFVNTIPLSNSPQSDDDGRRLRVMHAVLMVMTTPEYTVQH